MKAPTAKELYALAASVRGARGMGIETAASRSAPSVLAAADAALDRMMGFNSPSAPSQTAEMRYAGNVGRVINYGAAIDELRDAMGL